MRRDPSGAQRERAASAVCVMCVDAFREGRTMTPTMAQQRAEEMPVAMDRLLDTSTSPTSRAISLRWKSVPLAPKK